ncbi:MAG: GGDEF domain-containing protein [Solirubrobacterales bacterium]|nr:GGDEF domain-containing protein [Solirubrobacterales bacterium]
MPGPVPAAVPGPDAPVLTVADGGGRRELPGYAMELIAFAAIGIAVMLLIPGSTLTRAAGALALVALAVSRGWAHGRELGPAARAAPPLLFALCISALSAATAEPLYDVILCFNVLVVALQEDRRTLAVVIGGTWIALAVPAAIHPMDLGLRALVWAVLLPILSVPIQRRSEELRVRVGLGPRLRSLQAAMLSNPDSRETLIESAPGLTGCEIVLLVEPDSSGTFVVTAANRSGLTGTAVPEDARSLVHRTVRAGRPVFVPDAANATDVPPQLHDDFAELSTWFCAPVMRSGLVAAVLVTAWGEQIGKADDLRVDIVRSLASEASTTIDHTDLLRSLSDTASRDPLTGLTNRRGWDGLLAKEMAIARSRRTPLAVAIIDLDRFKEFNDVHGHRAGDRLLREAAGSWTAAIRKGDELARWGGEEFTLLLPDCGGACALDVVERLRADTPGGQTCSAGVAAWNGRESAAELFERMDAALYAAKAAGRDMALLAAPPEQDRPLESLAR